MVLVFLTLLVYVLLKHRYVINYLVRQPVVMALLAYAAYMLIDTTVRGWSLQRLGGLVINGRFILIFITTWLLAALIKKLSLDKWSKLTIITSLMVCLIGIAVFLLPNTLLEQAGYDPAGVDKVGVPAATYYVSAGTGIERVQAFMRSPNSVGLYLLIPLAILMFDAIKLKSRQTSILAGLIIAIIILTFSRAALLGLVLLLAIWLGREIRHGRVILSKRLITGLLLTGVLVLTIGGVIISKVPVAREIIFHETSQQTDGSTSIRVSEYSQSLEEIVDNPLGEGVGSASVAGRVNDTDVPRTTENYYLQIAREVGVVGLALFTLLITMVAVALRKGSTPLSRALLATLVIFSVAALFLPVWGEEAVSLTWWSLAGLVLGQAVQKTKKLNRKRTNRV